MTLSLSMPRLPRKTGNVVPRSSAERMWLMAGGVAAFALILIGYFLVISPQRSQTSDVQSRIDAARTQNLQLQSKLSSLRAQNKNIAKYETDLRAAQLALPSTSGIPDFLRTLQSLGSATLTQVTSLTVGQPTNVTTLAATVPAAAASPTATASPAPGATTATGTAPTGPAIYALAINAQVSGTPAALNKFLEQLQAVQPRAVLITQITEGSATTTGGVVTGGAPVSGSTTLQLLMQAFVAPTNPVESSQLAQQAAGK
jgi:hypothetical protein